ncbi:MAG: glycosyltransferase family 39 protein [Niabella sp.]
MTDHFSSARGMGNKSNSTRLLLWFMCGWFIVNAFQAYFLGVDADEAYYWMLSQQLDWGYFDHPPVVTLLIQAGESFGHGPFFTRLGTLLISTCSIAVIYAALPDDLKNLKYYLWLFAATLLFNVYSFITTPDAPLLFFSACFFYAYKRFLKAETLGNTLLMALSVTGMFYSKYHGVLPVLFVVLSNLRLLANPKCWLMAAIVIILFFPHLYWQYAHEWATVKFHLFERATKKYKIEYTTNYLLGQLLVWGPVISIFFYISLHKIKTKDKLVRAHLFNFTGILSLFFLSSFRNNVQPHWTLVAGTSFVVLFMYLIVNGTDTFRRAFLTLCYINIALILITRILFFIPGSPVVKIKNYKPFFQARAWADSIYQKAGATPVIFTNSYSAPSLYRFYHPDVTTIGYNTKTYRKTNYSISNEEKKLDGKDAFWFREGAPADSLIKIFSAYKDGNLVPVKNFSAIQNLKIRVTGLPQKVKKGQHLTVHLKIENNSTDTIYNRNGLVIEYSYTPLSYTVNNGAGSMNFTESVIPPGYTTTIPFTIVAPAETGKNRILFSFRNGIFDGNFASDYYRLEVAD